MKKQEKIYQKSILKVKKKELSGNNDITFDGESFKDTQGNITSIDEFCMLVKEYNKGNFEGKGFNLLVDNIAKMCLAYSGSAYGNDKINDELLNSSFEDLILYDDNKNKDKDKD